MKALILSILLMTSCLFGCILNVQAIEGKKMGYYIGSFDPLHLGHQHVIGSSLEQGHVECVLIYPAPGGDAFKNEIVPFLVETAVAPIHFQAALIWLS